MLRSFLRINRWRVYVALLVCATASLMFVRTGAQGTRQLSLSVPQQNITTGKSSQQANSKSIASIRNTDTPNGSRVTIVSDVPLNDYEAYWSGDRFFVVIPNAELISQNAQTLQTNLRGQGFQDVRVERRGNDLVFSFRMLAGMRARPEQKFNRLDVIFTAPPGVVFNTTDYGGGSAGQALPGTRLTRLKTEGMKGNSATGGGSQPVRRPTPKQIIRQSKGTQPDSNELPIANNDPSLPTSTHLDELMAECVRRLKDGKLALSISKSMYQGVSERVIVRISAEDINNAIMKGLPGNTSPEVENIKVGLNMKVHLFGQADQFKIDNLSSEAQLVEGRPYAQWDWNVTPLTWGDCTLYVMATVKIGDKSVDVPVFDRPIHVKVSYKYIAMSLAKNHWPYIMIVALISVVAAVAFQISRKTVNKTARTQDGGSKVNILFLAANPAQTSRLDLEEELRALESELRGVKYRDQIQLNARHAVRPDDLLRYVRSDSPTIIHFSGHGSTTGIILRSDVGGYQEITGPNLRRFLKGRGVQLLVLNACYSKTQAKEIKKTVNAVVGTTSEVEDEAARRFTVAFYRALGDGLTIREAFRDGGDAVELHGLQDVFYSTGDLDSAVVNLTNA